MTAPRRWSGRAARVLAALLTVLAISAPTAGANGDPGPCVRISSDAERLACYDQALGFRPDPHAASDAGKPTFGALPSKKKESDPDISRELKATVTKSEPLAEGLYRLTLNNGQVWMTKESDWTLEFEAGDAVIIRRLLLGSYRISFAAGGRDVLVRRIL